MKDFEDRSFKKVAPSIDPDHIRFDAIIKHETNAPKRHHEWRRYLTSTSLSDESALAMIREGPSKWEDSHILITSDGPRIVRNDCINPHRERSP